MTDSITVRGIVATDPRHLITESGLAVTTFRLASQTRRWDKAASRWVAGTTNWFSITAFRSLAANAGTSLAKSDRVIICGRLRVRNWERDNRSGASVEIEADAIGHDLAWGMASWTRTPRKVGDDDDIVWSHGSVISAGIEAGEAAS